MHLNGARDGIIAPPRADDQDAGDDDLRDRGLVPFAMWLFARRHPWRLYGVASAHANPPAARLAQLVPAQQSVAMRSHASPALAQREPLGAGIVASSATQAVAPVGPAQRPLQQSSPALQEAPSGAQVP
jgi:hypothetical protein